MNTIPSDPVTVPDIPHATNVPGDAAQASATAARPPAETAPAVTDLQRVADDINQYLRPVNRSLRFSIDRETGTTIATLYDKGSQQVIRQIPSEEQLAIMHAIDRLRGLMLRTEA
ncbi:MAG TPA: flagellar protein FlaG [Burkholderiales bacterium]|nr:flagellar protein FlaG [Burkholderiales bacterium]